MIPLDQYVGVDVMINPPSLENFHDGKITNDTQDIAAQNLDDLLCCSCLSNKLKTDLYMAEAWLYMPK